MTIRLHPFPLFVYHPNEIMVECVGAMFFCSRGSWNDNYWLYKSNCSRWLKPIKWWFGDSHQLTCKYWGHNSAAPVLPGKNLDGTLRSLTPRSRLVRPGFQGFEDVIYETWPRQLSKAICNIHDYLSHSSSPTKLLNDLKALSRSRASSGPHDK